MKTKNWQNQYHVDKNIILRLLLAPACALSSKY